MKMRVYITDAEKFLAGEYDYSLRLVTFDDIWERLYPEWIHIDTIVVNTNVDITDITQAAVTHIDVLITNTRAELQSKVTELEDRRQKLMALEYSP